MTLKFLGNILDNSFEHEILANEKYGYNAIIKYKDNKEEILYNLTEIHYKYPSPISIEQIAFESDIKQTGCTRIIKDLESVEIIRAIKKD